MTGNESTACGGEKVGGGRSGGAEQPGCAAINNSSRQRLIRCFTSILLPPFTVANPQYHMRHYLPAPNPAAERTVIGYGLTSADSAQPATMVVRSLISGAVMREMTLPGHGAEATVVTQDLPNGVYAVSLLVNGRALATRRLLVNY